MKNTAAALVIGCCLAIAPGGRAFADYHYSYTTNAFAPDVDLYAHHDGCYQHNSKDKVPLDNNWALAPDGVHEKAHTPPATLLIFLPGHGSMTDDYTQFMGEAVRQGYYVIGLAYRNGQSIQNMCGYWADCPDAMLKQNVEKSTYNGFYSCGLTKEAAAEAADKNSINRRLSKFLTFLKQKHIANDFDWEQFYDYKKNDVVWSKIVIAGHSEGGATAAWITKNKNVIAGITFEAPYSDWDNATSEGQPENKSEYTPCHSKTACPYTQTGGHRDPERFASYLKNDSANWADKLWITLNKYDKGYDNKKNDNVTCDSHNEGICSGAPCTGGKCTIDTWSGLNMKGAAEALGKSESTFDSLPQSLNGKKWWTSTERPSGSCEGHAATVGNNCIPKWMIEYWDLVLKAAHP